ncbi:MAG: tRNA (adenosine(37)-N6)-dimethylallyltransferase MiaA [Bacteroidia bacterium]|nr:tRNA (adenosine(37)-N6)-dimethylallyltransferase MiaA [Bacteroidia bacterium]
MKHTPTLLVIAGPTAIGKTALSIQLAKHFNTSILSADSRQFFKEMSIGTAKPTQEEMQGITHYFIDSHSISEDFNVGKYETDAIQLLEKLFKEKDLVLLVGGSGLYVDAICNGLDELPEANENIRKQLEETYQTQGITALQEQLKELDPDYYAQVDLNNPQRLLRALEVCLSTGKPYSKQRTGVKKERNFKCIKIGLNTDREELYERINQRVDIMMQQGLLEEVKKLIHFKNKNALQTVGYKELFDHLEGEISLNEAIELIKQHTRNFAKRQLTWFRRDEQIRWFEPKQLDDIISYVETKIKELQ